MYGLHQQKLITFFRVFSYGLPFTRQKQADSGMKVFQTRQLSKNIKSVYMKLLMLIIK